MEIIYSKSAVKAINSMDKPTKQRIRAGIEKLPFGDVKKLQRKVNDYRLRIGDYRIIYTMAESRIEISDILPRGQAYKRL